MRARDARSSSVRASSISRWRSASSAARRSVMSKIAPSIHSAPAGPGHELAAVEHPAHLAVGADDPVLERERPASSDASAIGLEHLLAVVGVDDAQQRAPLAGDEVAPAG